MQITSLQPYEPIAAVAPKSVAFAQRPARPQVQFAGVDGIGKVIGGAFEGMLKLIAGLAIGVVALGGGAAYLLMSRDTVKPCTANAQLAQEQVSKGLPEGFQVDGCLKDGSVVVGLKK